MHQICSSSNVVQFSHGFFLAVSSTFFSFSTKFAPQIHYGSIAHEVAIYKPLQITDIYSNMNERNLKVEGDVFYMAGMNDGIQPNMFGTGTKTKRSACQS